MSYICAKCSYVLRVITLSAAWRSVFYTQMTSSLPSAASVRSDPRGRPPAGKCQGSCPPRGLDLPKPQEAGAGGALLESAFQVADVPGEVSFPLFSSSQTAHRAAEDASSTVFRRAAVPALSVGGVLVPVLHAHQPREQEQGSLSVYVAEPGPGL